MSHRVTYKDEHATAELFVVELGEALDKAWRMFLERRTTVGEVEVVSTYMADRTILRLQWSVEQGLDA